MASTEYQNLDPLTFSRRQKRKSDSLDQMIMLQESRKRVFQINKILKKPEQERSAEESVILETNPDLVKKAVERAKIRCKLKRRAMEIEDSAEVLKQKCDQLAEAIKKSKGICVYTGAGISTAASIPDYRGPNGVWTLLQKGQELKPQQFTDAEPTKTHMGLLTLYKHGKLKHVVSQNCDGLHLRSGLSKRILSEVHGNMYLEMCYKCKPFKEYLRLFDVTEKTGVRRHHTSRRCHYCKNLLSDTIVHFGEKGRLCSPYRWKEAAAAAENCDVILCLGTSLKVLKKYTCLWCMDRKPSKRPKLFIVNLQWTPKDVCATLKINGRCDDVMDQIMKKLGWKITEYLREKDPMFRFAVPLCAHEYKSTTAKQLKVPDSMKEKFCIKSKKSNSESMQNKETEQSSPAMISSIKTEIQSQHSCQALSSLQSSSGKSFPHDKHHLPNALDSSYENTNLKLTLKSNMCSCRFVDSSECTLCFLKNSCDKDHSYCRRRPRNFPRSLNTMQKKSLPLPWCSVATILMEHDYLAWNQFHTLVEAAGFVVSRPPALADCKVTMCQDEQLANSKCNLDSRPNFESLHGCKSFPKFCNTSSSSICSSSGSSESKTSNQTNESQRNMTSKPTTTTTTTPRYCVSCFYNKVKFSKLLALQGDDDDDDDDGVGHSNLNNTESGDRVSVANSVHIKTESAQPVADHCKEEGEGEEVDASFKSSSQGKLYSQSRSRSIPGWFGKGLSIRKKRRRF
ncbi:NAD-dependent protein deacetylase sir-2.1 [Octopus bimaculoides]|uniref:NAD-dependent protein deacetylase sir-2.1 n=1 Tax=Octopus bimaculoides TaxID=37653 RepID=UPI00071D72E9|nr:NAD-dependent protein deacetylase sir-2.1 [Octopus bimaculoides]|eukprot:XP_014773199.1 PREDICTED: NAD-dependent protein deacetylase sir-2.1-like [Octopus bimaculoides]